MSKKGENIFLAKAAEQSARYDDMVEFMREVVISGQELTFEERNLLSVAYKNAISARRASLRTINSIIEQDDKAHHTALNNYKQKVEKELQSVCNSILNLLEKHLLPGTGKAEYRVFYSKMKGDYKRYLAEFSSDQERKTAAEECLIAYKSASDIATTELTPTNPVRLGLALNFSVFYYEILDQPERACELADTALQDALAVLDDTHKDEYRDATVIMQLLKDNLMLWKDDEDDASVQDL